MFGYIRLNKPESKLREYEYYRAIYCGLCRALGKCTGQCTRMMLSYDMTFMTAVRLTLEGIRPTLEKGRCPVHPIRRRLMAKPKKGSDEARVFSLCACATVLLSYHKIRDDMADERGGRRFCARILNWIVRPLRRRASKGYKPLENAIKEQLLALSQWEKEGGASMDRPAEIFGELLASVLSYGLEGTPARLARDIGFHIGKWVYLVDAIDDYCEDVGLGRYNPLIATYGGELCDEARQSLLTALTAELCAAERAFDLLEYPDGNMEGIIKNIIYIGMPQTARKVLGICNGEGDCYERSV